MTYLTKANEVGDRVIATIGEAQDAALATVATVTERIGEALPALPTLPYASKIPAAKDVVDTYFTLASRLLETQRHYALGLVEALEPVTSKVLGSPAKKRKAPAKTAA